MNWYAIRTKTKKEKHAKDYYSKLGVEAYVPTYTTKRVWSDRIKKTKAPAITGYLFFRLKKIDFDLVNLNPYTTNVVRAGSGLFCSEKGIIEKFIQNRTLVLLKSLNIKLVISASNLKFQKTA